MQNQHRPALSGACHQEQTASTVTCGRGETSLLVMLLVLCMCLYGPAMLHVCRMHAVCGYRGQHSCKEGLRALDTCGVVDLPLHVT